MTPLNSLFISAKTPRIALALKLGLFVLLLFLLFTRGNGKVSEKGCIDSYALHVDRLDVGRPGVLLGVNRDSHRCFADDVQRAGRDQGHHVHWALAHGGTDFFDEQI